mgnify:FL=1
MLLGSVLSLIQRDTWFSNYHTDYGGPKVVSLSDGSILTLDTNTAVDVDITAEHRRITLRRGQIHAVVAHDPARPFEVNADGGKIRALGTAFNVRRDGDGGDVAVTEHVVRVSLPGLPQATEVYEGQHLRYGAGALGVPAKVDLRTVTAWQRGYLVFDGAPLSDVLMQVAHYHRGYTLVRDESIESLKLTGVFRTADTDALLEALPQTLPVHLRRLPGLLVIEAGQR